MSTAIQFWGLLLIQVVAATAAVIHILLNKSDPRAALGWIGVCVLFPLAGPLLYYTFGINRVRTRAQKLDQSATFRIGAGYRRSLDKSEFAESENLLPSALADLAAASNRIADSPLVPGNKIEVLHNGEEAYPAMLAAIDGAEKRLYLTTYIFETNPPGREFIRALARAHERGVDVRVLLDGVGEYYAFPRAGAMLRKQGVPTVRFLPPRLFPPSLKVNLRNHRKILVADGHTAFTGGMNIGGRHLSGNEDRVVDMHFCLRGAVARQIEQVFLDDWAFVTGDQDRVELEASSEAGDAVCRVIMDGPNEDIDTLSTLLLSAICAAKRRIHLMTPYFLPSAEVVAALQAAALRGVDVTIILPGQNNLPFVHWASRHSLGALLRRGVRVFYQPAPFAHTKLFLVDDGYALIGSANIDPRSLRLNFELNVEVYQAELAETLSAHFDTVRKRSNELTPEQLEARSLPVRLKDSFAWLFSPYL